MRQGERKGVPVAPYRPLFRLLGGISKYWLQLNRIDVKMVNTGGGVILGNKRFTITISEEMHNWIATEAEKRALPMNAVVIFALEHYRNTGDLYGQMEVLKALVEKVDEG